MDDLRVAGGEDAVPKQAHLLLKLCLRGYHAIQPVFAGTAETQHAGLLIMEAAHHIIAHPLRVLGWIKQFNDYGVVALGFKRMKLCASCTEASAAHQVCQQSEVSLRLGQPW